ncbi:hypothetical protein U6G28_03635 [Actinomycetaceae bacterium MB13-C1-2]|nr:hypothetical protein U6G28_03635 [Actinomycetaceae bacterium MB13-C1-2]
MPVEFKDSADKHRIPREDAIHAMVNAVASEQVEGEPGEVTTVYVGHPHPQTERYIEVIVALRPPRTLTVFHVQPLSDRYRHLLYGGSEQR